MNFKTFLKFFPYLLKRDRLPIIQFISLILKIIFSIRFYPGTRKLCFVETSKMQDLLEGGAREQGARKRWFWFILGDVLRWAGRFVSAWTGQTARPGTSSPHSEPTTNQAAAFLIFRILLVAVTSSGVIKLWSKALPKEQLLLRRNLLLCFLSEGRWRVPGMSLRAGFVFSLGLSRGGQGCSEMGGTKSWCLRKPSPSCKWREKAAVAQSSQIILIIRSNYVALHTIRALYKH